MVPGLAGLLVCLAASLTFLPNRKAGISSASGTAHHSRCVSVYCAPPFPEDAFLVHGSYYHIRYLQTRSGRRCVQRSPQSRQSPITIPQ